MSNATPEHDAYCEGDFSREGQQESPCLCADRRERRAEIEKREAEGSPGIDPRLLKIRVKRVRQAEAALATVKRTLVTYIAEHAPSSCQYGVTPTDDRAGHFDCTTDVDGFVLLSCGHHVYTCRVGGSRILSEVAMSSRGNICTKRDGLHDGHDAIVTLEWCGL